MKNIALIGMPGSGKTTFGKGLARVLCCPFVDADDYLEKKEGRTIQSFFAESEKAFRDAEERTIRDLSRMEGIVIATGGGVIKRKANVDRLHEGGLIIFRDRLPEDIVTDVEVEKRPLLREDSSLSGSCGYHRCQPGQGRRGAGKPGGSPEGAGVIRTVVL